MKTDLEPQREQAWSLLGMKPMHRAILRRTAERAAGPMRQVAASSFELTWSVSESIQSIADCLGRPGILLLDREALDQGLQNHRDREWDIGLLYPRSHAQIRLLWSWSKRGKDDLMWCTEMSFDGVLYDLASMERWVRVCLKRGPVIPGQSNRLLRELTLPTIAPRTSSLL